MSAKLDVQSVCKHFTGRAGTCHALADVSLQIGQGEFVAVVGASGCGKSTLLRIIAGLEEADSGAIRVDGRRIAGPSRDRAMVFQDYSLFPWLTVLQNICFSAGLRVNRRAGAGAGAGEDAGGAAAADRATRLLEVMGLLRVCDQHPAALSGGMRQRVAIARALMNEPEVLLMDEPFGALDAQTREVMHELMLHLIDQEQRTVVFVTHDVQEAIYLADRVVVLAPDPGHVDSVWPIALPPARARTQDLKRSAAFLALETQILDRIRATARLQSDRAALQRLSGTGEFSAPRETAASRDTP